tara:strand:- start:3813 stop:11204 length:7392 start_codon:yes stop_codon:yes gene_type:complete
MEPNHLINTLTLELDKGLSRDEVDRLKSRILDAIEYCFSKYYPYAKHLNIEDISLDLGTIDSKNFQEEFIVRLSYLLDTELAKLLQQKNIDELIDQQNILNDLELFVYFLKTGVMISGSDSLTSLFQRLIKNDLHSLRFNLKKVLSDEIFKERFFHQIKEDQLDEYWLSIEPIIYLEIRRFNYTIQEIIWKKKQFKSFQKEVNDSLRRVTFDFMINDYRSISLNDYIKFLQLKFRKAQDLAEEVKTLVYHQIKESIKGNELEESFKQTSSIKRLIEELTIYIIKERTPALSVAKKQTIRKVFFRREIEEIVLQFTKSSFTIKKFIRSLERIYKVLNPQQIELFFQMLQRENKFSFQKELIELSAIIQLTRPIFPITLYDLGFLWMSDVILELKQQFKKRPALLFILIDQVSIRTGYGRDYIIETMIKSEGSEMAKAVLIKHRKEVVNLYKKDSSDSGLIDTYLYYLKSGIWELGDQSPDEVLIMLLKDHVEPFILALKKEQVHKVVWLRLIHGHELRSVEKVIMAFFQGIQRKKKFEKIIKSINQYDTSISFKKHIFERLIIDPSWFDNLPFSDKGFNMNRIKEEVDSFFSQEQNIKDLSLVPLINYLDEGTLEFDYSLIEILKMAKRLRKKDLIALSMIISFGTNNYQNKLKLKRIFEIFSWNQIDILFVIFARQETKKRKAFENFHYLKIFLHTLFSENIYHYGHQQIAGFINHFSMSDPQLNRSLYELLERVALKKDMVFTELLSTIIAHLDPGEYSKLIALRRQLIQSQTILETAKEKSHKFTDDLLLLLNYLELGVWLSVDLDPISSLKKVLEDNFDQLTIQFKKRISHQIFWLRLLYQFDLDIVLEITLQVFKDTDGYIALQKYLSELDQSDQDFKFKLLETFILVKMDVDKGENFDDLFQYQVALFRKKDAETDGIELENIDLDEGKIFNDFNLLLTVFFDNPTESQADLVWVRFNSEVGHDVILNNFFINGQYPWTLWAILFKKGSKVDLIRLLSLSLLAHVQNSWEIKLVHFFGTRNRFSFFKKSNVLDFFKALHSKDSDELKNQFTWAWATLLKKKPNETGAWLEEESFNQFIGSSNGYDLISKDAQFNLQTKDLTELENDLLLLLSGQMGNLVEEVRLKISDWILNIVPVAPTKIELKELLYLKLLSFATPRKVIDLNLLIRNFSPEMRLSVFTQIINFNIVEINQILHQQRLLYLFLESLLEDQSLSVQFFLNIDKKKLSKFLSLLSSQTLAKLMLLFDDKKDDEALLLAAVREFQETPSKSDLQPSTEAKDLALLRVVIEEGGISRTPFNRWSSFETFFKDLLVRGVLTTQFFKEIESSTLNKFYKLLSSDLLISIESLFGPDTPMLSPLHLLITSDEGAALEKEFLNLNDLGDLAPVSSFDLYPHRTFGILLEKVIELEFKEAETPYLNFQEFEFQFRNQLSIQSTIWQILTRQSIGKMKIFLRVLQQETLAELIKLIDYKFGGISFNEIMNSIKKANQKSMLELEVLMVIFGLSHDHYDQESLLKFLDDQINFFIIPDEFEVFLLALKKNEITLYYVDAFIIFLKDRNKLNEGIFIYESEEAFNRILHFKREFFISRLRKDRDVEQVLISLFQRLPEKLISQYFNQMMPDYAGQWEPLWQSMVFSVSKIVFTSKLILLGLRNIQKIEFNILSGLLLAQLNPKKSVAPPKLTLSKAAKADLDQLKSLSYVSIKDDYLAHFDIYDFVEVVITTGTFPNWSAVHSVERFYEILVKLAKVDGHHFKLNIDALIKKSADLDFLISFLGEKKFLSLYKIIRPSVHGQAQKIAKQFEQAFTAVVKKSVLTNYFILIILRYQHEYPTANDELIWDEMLDQWSISMQMSKIELIDLAGSQESQEISAYLESTKLNTITYANKELAWQGDIDFLLHLILYNEYPWWSIELDHQGFSKSENLVRLTNQMLNEHPKSFIEAVSMLKRPDGVFEKIIPIMKPQVIDRILLILSPQHGAFVVNFNILIKRWGYLKAKDEWITFLFRYFSHLESFDHDRFILSSVTFITKKTPFVFPKVKEQLLKITSDALHEGEMKFLPFMKLFNDLNLNDEVMPIPNSHLVQHHPNKDFIAIVTYYITTGSLPADYAFLIKSYLAFVRKIESYLNTGHEDVRVAIISVMENSDVRTRVVRNEKEDILFLITRVLFPKHTKSLMEYKSDIIKLFTQIWPYIQPKIINELFYQTIYQSVLNAKFMNLNALDLVHLFLQQFKKVNQISFDFDVNAYAYLNISDKLIEMIVSFNTSKQVRDIPKENDSEVKLLPIILDPIDDIESVKLEHRIEIKNAGIVIVWPYLDRFFQMLEMTEKGSFKTEGDALRATHLIQYLITGSNETPEHELLLNKILCGIKLATPVPLQIELTDKEKETSDLMLKGVIQNWEKLKSSSIDAMREGFFVRQGFIEEKDDFWELEVEKKTIDILLKSLPWGFGTVKLPWMSKRMIVNWT